MSRQSLGEISGNSNYRGGIEDRFELTPHWHFHIVGRAAGGQVSKTIVNDLGISLTTVKTILSQTESHYNNESLYQSSSSNIVFDSLCHHLLCEVCVNLKI